MAYQNIFKRYEFKYLITMEQMKKLKDYMQEYMMPDKFGESEINNIYFDTKSKLLVRRSNESPFYKEKLRMRSYNVATEESKVFIEIKKKYDGIVYKRRVSMSEHEAMEYLCQGVKREQPTQIMKEIDYFCSLYPDIQPYMYISYDRQAFYGKEDSNFRLTFDRNILHREYDLNLKKGAYGESLLDKNMVLLEVKTIYGMPLWLTSFFTENHIYKASFSKYGSAYKQIISREKVGKSYVA